MKNNKTENVYGEKSPEQEAIEERTQEILEVLNKEPKMRLYTFLRATEQSISSDVKLVMVEEKVTPEVENEEGNTTEPTEEGSDTDVVEGTEETGDDESTEA